MGIVNNMNKSEINKRGQTSCLSRGQTSCLSRGQTPIFTIISTLLLFAVFFLSIAFGAEKLPLSAFFGKANQFQKIIIWQLRLPRSLLVLLTGVLLGGSGAVFQLFFRNELAEPGLIGISSGATMGAVIASCLGLGTASLGQTSGNPFKMSSGNPFGMSLFTFISPVNLFAFLGAIAAGSVITFLALNSHRGQTPGFSRGQTSVILLLCGTALGTLYSSISSIILISSNKEIRSIYSWILGSFNGRGWNELLFILIPSIISIIIMIIIQPQLDLLGCGETSAKSLGVSVNRLRILVLLCGAFAVSAAVCAGGTISFVGLIAPHIVRRLTNPKSKTLIPFSMISGAILLLASDTIARLVIAPAELPTGIITSILGVPFFLSLFLKK